MTEEKSDVDESNSQLYVKKHIQYFIRCVGVLPSYLQSLDTSRMTLLFFSLGGLDVLNALDQLEFSQKVNIKRWIYGQQILPDYHNPDLNAGRCGFRGSSFLGVPSAPNPEPCTYPYDCSHIAMTYTALACLLMLEDDLSGVDREAVIRGVVALQQPNGSFSSTIDGTETDMRFVYCACAVCYILNKWDGVDVDAMVAYIMSSMNYDAGFGQGPFLESHGGSTFCAVASLYLIGVLDTVISPAQRERLIRWCINRQTTGFQGRPNKPVDTCYSFWIGATLELLKGSHVISRNLNCKYVLSTQGKHTGGFSKWPDCHPDPLHSYLGLCGLSLGGELGLVPIHPALNITFRASEFHRSIRYLQ